MRPAAPRLLDPSGPLAFPTVGGAQASRPNLLPPMEQPITPGTPGTPAPGTAPIEPGTSTQLDPSKFVTQEAFNGAAAMISRMNKALESFTAQKPLAEQLAELGLIEKGDDGSYKPRGATTPQPGGKKPEDDPTARELAALKKQLADKDADLEARDRRAAELDRNRAVTAALGKAGAVNPDRDFIHVAGNVIKNENGEYVVRGKGVYGEDVDTPLEAFAADWLKKNPELMRATTMPGSGAPAKTGQPGGAASGARLIPSSQWKDMNWYAANRSKFLTGEYARGE